MLTVTFTRLIQHLLTQNEWAAPMLQPFAGQSVQLNVMVLKTSLVILENGSLAIAGKTLSPDAIITIPPSLLLRLMAKDEAAKLQIRVEGDTQLATAFAKVMTHIRWDYEDDVSKVAGDIAAGKLGQFTRKSLNVAKDSALNVADMLSEYLQEEKLILAKKRHVDNFNKEVDILRADVERMEKRLNRIASARMPHH